MVSKTKHKHLLLNAWCLNPLSSGEEATSFLATLVETVGMKITTVPTQYYVEEIGNRGMTAIVGVATSRFSIHVLDEDFPHKAQLDIYTCESLDVEKILGVISSCLYTINGEYQLIDRENGFILIEEGGLLSA